MISPWSHQFFKHLDASMMSAASLFPSEIAGYAEYLGLDRARGVFHVPKHLDKKFEN
jgi:hypothetical protein